MSQETACNCCQVKVPYLGLKDMKKKFNVISFVIAI